MLVKFSAITEPIKIRGNAWVPGKEMTGIKLKTADGHFLVSTEFGDDFIIFFSTTIKNEQFKNKITGVSKSPIGREHIIIVVTLDSIERLKKYNKENPDLRNVYFTNYAQISSKHIESNNVFRCLPVEKDKCFVSANGVVAVSKEDSKIIYSQITDNQHKHTDDNALFLELVKKKRVRK